MTGRLWIYIGSQGIVQGTYETNLSRRAASTRSGGSPVAGSRPPARRKGRRAAAGRRRWTVPFRCIECRQQQHRLPFEDPLRRRTGLTTSTTHSAPGAVHRRWRRRCPSVCSAMPPSCCPFELEQAPDRRTAAIDMVTDQTSAHDPVHMATCRSAGATAQWTTDRDAKDPMAARRGEGVDAPPVRGDAGVPGRRAHGRLRQQHPAEAVRRRTRGRRVPGFVPAYVRPLFCRGVGRSAGRRCPAIRRHPQDRCQAIKELFPEDAHLHTLAGHGARAHQFQVCRRASAGRLRRAPPLAWLCSTRWWRSGEPEGADGDRSRPPGQRQRRVAQPRNRGHARRHAIVRTGRCSTRCSTRGGGDLVSLHHGGGVGMGQ